MTESSSVEQIKELEKQLSTTKYNKKTEHAIGLMKVKIAHMKEQLEAQRAKKKQVQRPSYAVKKDGDATVALIGVPSVGKSTLIDQLTNANSRIGSYDFTTQDCIPGIMEYKGAKIQILDLPGILEGAAEGTGKGKEAISVLRNADLVLLIADAYAVEKELSVIRKEVYKAGIRLNQEKPDVKIDKKIRGGITISKTVKLTAINDSDIKAALKEFRLLNADIVIREKISIGQLIDVITNNRKYCKGLIVINKIDMMSSDALDNARKILQDTEKKSAVMKKKGKIHYVMISAEKRINLEGLKEAMYNTLSFIRIYLKEIGKGADVEKPLILIEHCKIKDVCRRIHGDFVVRFKFARVWGASAKFPGQKFHLEHELKDGDILQIHLK